MADLQRETREQRAPRGRPRKLSHAAVVDAAIGFLDERPLEEFTLARLARRLGAGTMSLYTYFPSRDALLDAVADRVFELFALPPPEARWQDSLLAWLRAWRQHFERYPVARKILAWDGHVAPAWMRITAPVVVLLRAQGLSGRRLANAYQWFITASIGLLLSQQYTRAIRWRRDPSELAPLDPESAAAIQELWAHEVELAPDAALEFGFRHLIAGVDAHVRGEAGA